MTAIQVTKRLGIDEARRLYEKHGLAPNSTIYFDTYLKEACLVGVLLVEYGLIDEFRPTSSFGIPRAMLEQTGFDENYLWGVERGFSARTQPTPMTPDDHPA